MTNAQTTSPVLGADTSEFRCACPEHARCHGLCECGTMYDERPVGRLIQNDPTDGYAAEHIRRVPSSDGSAKR